MKITGNLIAGIVLIALGVIFLLGISNFWPLILMVLGFFLLSKKELTISFVLITIGSMFLITELTNYDMMNRFWPLILIVIGISLLLKNFRNSQNVDNSTHSSDSIDMSVFLSEGKQRVLSQNFKGGKIDVMLGDAKLDLSEAKISGEGAKLSVSCLLGSVKITAPRDVIIESIGAPILGEWQNDYRTDVPQDKPTLIIDGTAILGEVKIN